MMHGSNVKYNKLFSSFDLSIMDGNVAPRCQSVFDVRTYCLLHFLILSPRFNYGHVPYQMSHPHILSISGFDNNQMFYIMWTQVLVTLSSLSTCHLICHKSSYRYNFTECSNEILNCQDTCSEISDSFILG